VSCTQQTFRTKNVTASNIEKEVQKHKSQPSKKLLPSKKADDISYTFKKEIDI
jgi:hypothetical protein